MKKSNSQGKIKKATNINVLNSAKTSSLPPNFYQNVLEAENTFYSFPTQESCIKLMLLYKTGAEHFSRRNKAKEKYFVQSIQKILTNRFLKKYSQKQKDTLEKKKGEYLKAYFGKFNLSLMDFTPKAKSIIQEYIKNIKDTSSLIKKSEQNQKEIFSHKSKIKTFKMQLEDEDEDEDGDIELYDNLKKKAHQRSGSQFKHMDSFYSKYKKKRGLSVKGKLMKEMIKRRNSVNDNGIESIKANRASSMASYSQKHETSSELIDFLNEYNKRLYFFFQTQINESIEKLNKVLIKAENKKKRRYTELLDNVGDFELIGNLYEKLIKDLKVEYAKDVNQIDERVARKIERLCAREGRTKLKDEIKFSNLNVETLGQIYSLFK